MPQTHNISLCKLHSTNTCLSKVFLAHVVLSTLYQEEMVTEQEMKGLKVVVSLWGQLVQIQCTKPPHVVKRTAELLAEAGCDERQTHLKSEECMVSSCS